MLRRTFLGILAAIPFWRKAKAEERLCKTSDRRLPPSKGDCGKCSLPVHHTFPWHVNNVPYHDECFRSKFFADD